MQTQNIKYYLVFLGIFIANIVDGQILQALTEKIESTPPTLHKVQLLNELVDTILWIGDAVPHEEQDYLQQVWEICETIDCGSDLLHAKILDLHYHVLRDEKEGIYQFAIPTLREDKITNDEHKAYLLEICALFYFFESKLDSVKYYLDEAQQILEHKVPDDKRKLSTYEYLGFYYSFQTQHDTSLIYMTKALKGHLANKDTLAYIKTNKFISSFYNLMGKQDSALHYLLTAQEYINLFPLALYQQHRVNIGIANIYLEMDQYKDAIHRYQNSLNTLTRDNSLNKEDKIINRWEIITGLAEAYTEMDQPEKALPYLATADSLCEHPQLTALHYISTKLVEGNTRAVLKQYERVSEIIEEILTIGKKGVRINVYSVRIAHIVSKILFNEEYSPSPELMNELMPLLDDVIASNEGQYNKEVRDIYKLRALFNIYQENNEAALSDFKMALVHIDTLNKKEINEAVSEMLVAYETKEKEQQLKIQELELQQRTAERNSLLLATTALIAVFSALLYFFWQRQQYTKKLEQEVKKRTADLQQSNIELERFNYIASHDLKEPIRNILSFSGLLKRHLGESKTANEFYQHIALNSRQMHNLLEKVQTFFSIRQRAPRWSEVDLEQLIQSLKQDYAPMLTARNAQIITQDLPIIKTDEKWMSILLSNLIENGIQHNNDDCPRIDIRYAAQNSNHIISISDNGIGIPAAYYKKVFELFTRLQDRENSRGAGIGLAICKRIVDKLNGKLVIESIEGKGTVFHIHLPVKQ